MPLIEKVPTDNLEDDRLINQITGTQLLIEQKHAQKPYAKPDYYHFNIRNTIHDDEWNYLSKFTKSKLRTFNHGLKGVIAQTTLRPAFIINNNMQAKLGDKHMIFSIDEALHLLKDINK